MIRFGALEFLAVPRAGHWAPPLFQPSQSFHFGSLDFITDKLGSLHVREEEPTLAAKEDTVELLPQPPRPIRLRRRRVLRPCTRKRGPSCPVRAVL